MGAQESNTDTLHIGTKFETRLQIKNMLSNFHKEKPQGVTIVVSNITKRRFTAICTREYDEQNRLKKQRSSGIKEGNPDYKPYKKQCSGIIVLKLTPKEDLDIGHQKKNLIEGQNAS